MNNTTINVVCYKSKKLSNGEKARKKTNQQQITKSTNNQINNKKKSVSLQIIRK